MNVLCTVESNNKLSITSQVASKYCRILEPVFVHRVPQKSITKPRMPTTQRVFHKLKELYKVADNASFLVNRNPRNLEKLRIAYKPSGYHLEQPGRNFWHKYEFGIYCLFLFV